MIPRAVNGAALAHRTDPGVDPVREFYVRHPYPPPVSNLDQARDEWQDPNRHRAEYRLFWPTRPYRTDYEILVAGCGTWQAAKYALCRPDAGVVGIDVSTTSLDHTERLKRKYHLANLALEQLPIERAESLHRRFDLVVCTGVLHHLADPDAGLRALDTILKPGGAMYLMVYAPYGRIGVSMLQDYCRRLGVGTSKQEIDELAGALEPLAPQHPLAPLLRSMRDASHAGALADTLLNPRERAYSVPELFDFVERQGLTPTRWYWQAPYLPKCGSIARTRHAVRLSALPVRDQYAAMELWRGTMTCHSIVVQRAGAAEADRRISFDHDRWQRYVPLRMSYTVCVRDRLPPGASGVLLNRSHQHSDLVLPIAEREGRMFDAIDGRRDITAIARHAGTDRNWPGVRAFFETLWRYDQVVFDASVA